VTIGKYLKDELVKIPGLQNCRGRGLMIGFDVPDELSNLRKKLLMNQKIFTGESKPNVIRLLPSLALRQKDADHFLESIKEEIHSLVSSENTIN
jgi:acetylornithine aminotransferase